MSGFELKRVRLPLKKIADYKDLTPETLKKVEVISKNIKNLRIAHINATDHGGGVAEMLRSVIPLERDIGLKSDWLVIPGSGKFFNVTKKIHNFLQGKKGNLTQKEKEVYLLHNKKIAKLLDKLKYDILFIHDPQPLPSASFLEKTNYKKIVWRCHIDTTTPNKSVWKFISKFLRHYERYVFTARQFANKEILAGKVLIMTPAIDAFSEKNKFITQKNATDMLKVLGVNTNKPLVTQISRLDPWKDPLGVIDAFVLAQKQIPDLQLALVAQSATDDPEVELMNRKVKEYAEGKKNINIFLNLKPNDLYINAFQKASTVILQKSIREGFALTVTEAMWKGAVVVGGKVGGIPLQIKDGKNGFLVFDTKQAAKRIVKVINDPQLAKGISSAAKKSVQQKFLMPHLILNQMMLYSSIFT